MNSLAKRGVISLGKWLEVPIVMAIIIAVVAAIIWIIMNTLGPILTI